MKDQSPFIIGAFKIPSAVDLPVSAAIHGDEMIGVEIARRLLRAPQLDRIKGTLLVIPIVNSIGFLDHSRYLPDRRDLN
jgi:predicted deacylase